MGKLFRTSNEYIVIGESHDGRQVGPGLRSMQSYEEPTRDPDVWPAPPPKDPDVWSAPTTATSVGGGHESFPRVRPVRGPRKSESVGTDRGGSNRAASRNAKGPVGNVGAAKKGNVKDGGRSGPNYKDISNKDKSRKGPTGGIGRSTGDKDKVIIILRLNAIDRNDFRGMGVILKTKTQAAPENY